MASGAPVYGSGLLELSPQVTAGASRTLSGSLGKLGKVAGAAFAATFAAAVGVGVKGVKAFAELEKGMNEVFTLLPGISQAAMDDLTGQVRDFSKEFAVLPDEVVPSLYQALSAGVPKDNVFEFLEIAQKAALGGVTELETAVDGISSVVNSYGADVIDASEASDLMFTAVRLGKTNFEELSGSLFNVIPTASALGVEFGDVTAALAMMTAQGVPTSVATTQLRQLFVELSKEGGKASKMFEDMSGQTFAEFIEAGGDTAGALETMLQASDKTGIALQDMFGSVEAGAAALALASDGTEDYFAIVEEMQGAAGATDAAYEQMDQGLSRTWDRIKVTFNDAFLEIGERLAPHIQQFGDWFGEKLPGFIDSAFAWFDDVAIPAVKGFLDNAGGISGLMDKIKGSGEHLSGALTVLGGPLLLIVRELFPLIRPLLDAIIPPLAQLANGVAPTLAKILGFVSDEILPGFIKILESVIGWITKNKGLVVAFGLAVVAFKILTAVMAINPFVLIAAAVIAVAALIITNWDKIVDFLKRAWDRIKTAASTIWENIKTVFRKAVDFIKDLFFKFTPLGIIISKFDKIKEVATGAADWIRDKFNAVVDFFKKMPGRISSAVSGLWDGLKNAFKNAVNWIIDRWNAIKFTIPKIDTPFGTIGGGSFGVPPIPRLHDGGMVPGRPGQEMLAILEAGERVLSRAEVAAGEGGGTRDVLVQVHTDADPWQVGAAVSWNLRTAGV